MKLTESELAAKYREKQKGDRMTRAQENYIGYLMNALLWDTEDRERYWREKGLDFLSLSKKKASEVINDLRDRLKRR